MNPDCPNDCDEPCDCCPACRRYGNERCAECGGCDCADNPCDCEVW